MNLDLEAQRYAQKILRDLPGSHDDIENVLTKALGVVEENGIYAGLLFLLTRKRAQDEPTAKAARNELIALAKEVTDTQWVETHDGAQALEYLTKHVCQNLDTLLLVKQVWEQTLIYARFGAKANASAGA